MEFVLKLKSDFLKALAHPTRLRILEHLKSEEMSVGSMGATLGVEQSVLSKHLLLLKQAGVLVSRQQRTTVFYRIQDQAIYDMLTIVSKILRGRLVESRRLLGELGKPKMNGKSPQRMKV